MKNNRIQEDNEESTYDETKVIIGGKIENTMIVAQILSAN